MSYTAIDPSDRAAVLWLQSALGELTHGRHGVSIGKMDELTKKALIIFQIQQKLPVTGEPDETTLQKINQELQTRGITI